MSRWKKILIAAPLLIIVLILAFYAFLSIYDFNKFKPMIAEAVKNATDRELTIAGDIEFGIGIRPTLIVEDVRFQNASWSSRPNLARIQRLEVQIAALPLIFGKFDFAHLVLVQPDVIVEFDSSGTNNFAFDTASDPGDVSAISPPPLIFSDVLIENGKFTYRDARSDFQFSIRIDRLKAEIPGFDESLQLDFQGAFDGAPFTLNGTVGPIWAWVESGYTLPVDITVAAGGATAHVKGEMRDPTHLKDLAFDISTQGSSVAEITKLAKLGGVPELGAFKLNGNVNDAAGNLAINQLVVQIGSQKLAAISLTGNVTDVLALQGVDLNISVQGHDSANLTRFGLPALPERGAFRVAAQISDPTPKVYTISDISIVLGENEVGGLINLNLAKELPYLTAKLTSQKFRYGKLNLDLKMTGPAEKPAIEKLDLNVGNPDLAKIQLNGSVNDLLGLNGVDINFQVSGKDLANLEKVTGQPFPVRGAFRATGKVVIPVHQNLKVPDLKLTVGNNNISGSLNLVLKGEQPQLDATLSLPKLDLPSVLLPELAKQGWAKGLGQVRPLKLTVKLAGFTQELALKEVDLRAGTLKSAELRLTGSVANLLDQRGIDLNFSLRGDDEAKLKDIIAQPYFFAPVPGQGKYAISGHISDPSANKYEIKNFKFTIADTNLSGRLDFNLAGQLPMYEVQLAAPKFNLKPFPIPKEAAHANLNKIDDLGPLKIQSTVVIDGGRLSVPKLEMQAGSKKLAAVEVKGSIKDLTKQTGLDLNFIIQGNEVANLEKLAGQSLPLKGAYGLTGKLTDPAQKNYKISNLKFKLGENDISGSLDLNLSGNQQALTANLVATKFTLQPVTLPALKELSRIKDLGPLKLAFKLTGAGKKFTLENLDFKLGREDLIDVVLKGTIKDLSAAQGMKLDFIAKGNDMSNFKTLGGPDIPYKGAFNVSGQFIDPAPKIYKIPVFNAVVGDNNQSGWLELDLSGKRPHLKAELSSDKLDLRPLLAEDKEKSVEKAQSSKPVPQKDKKTKAKTQPSKSNVQNAKVFSSEPLPLEGLMAIDADLKFRDKQLLLPALALDDVILDILLKNGNLDIKPFKFSIGGGKADVQFALHSQEKPTALTTTLDIDQLEIGPMLEKLGYQRSVEGNMAAAFNLDSTGDSVAALMSALNGNIRIATSDGRMASKYLDLLEKYLGSGILRMLNPFQEKREFTPVNCFVNKIEIKDGLADVKILLDTDRTSLFGAGDVNLKTESLNLGIKPTPKKKPGAADISFSFRELSQPFRLGGTLAKPSLVIDPGRTAFVIGKFAGALALGPVGIAAFFGNVSVGKQDPCAVAMESAMLKDQPPDAKKAEESSEKSTAGDEKKKDKKSGGFFKRLFGK